MGTCTSKNIGKVVDVVKKNGDDVENVIKVIENVINDVENSISSQSEQLDEK